MRSRSLSDTYKSCIFARIDSQLTLRLDTLVIERAKRYARDHQTSLSKLIENYLQAITLDDEEDIDASPLVESLTGVISLEGEDYRKAYGDFLSTKYQ